MWAVGWWRWYRNRPEEKDGITELELTEIGPAPGTAPHSFPWNAIGLNKSVLAIMGAAFAYLYSYYFFLFWLPTYMMRAREFTESETKLSALPFVLGALANMTGGFARDAAVRRWGAQWGPRVVSIFGLITASVSAFAALFSENKYVALAWLALCYAGMTFQQPTIWATCVDIGKRYAGAVAGCMNTAAALGGLLSSLVFGYLIQRSGNYDEVLLSMSGALIISAGLWLRIDATETLEGQSIGAAIAG
jgi:predicted MFS family arabinose efflux permease